MASQGMRDLFPCDYQRDLLSSELFCYRGHAAARRLNQERTLPDPTLTFDRAATSYNRCAYTFFSSICTAATLAMSPEPSYRFPDNKKAVACK
jgi:hypothetical protein